MFLIILRIHNSAGIIKSVEFYIPPINSTSMFIKETPTITIIQVLL